LEHKLAWFFRRPLGNKLMPSKTDVLIVGGGFGGFYAALHFDKTIARDRNIEVTLVSRENFLLFTPMLPEARSDTRTRAG
jgi:NADH dehydrogenase